MKPKQTHDYLLFNLDLLRRGRKYISKPANTIIPDIESPTKARNNFVLMSPVPKSGKIGINIVTKIETINAINPKRSTIYPNRTIKLSFFSIIVFSILYQGIVIKVISFLEVIFN